jgi:hypothetical protein
MLKTFRAVVVIFYVVVTIGVSLSYCADNAGMNRCEGRISYLDWVTSRMVVNGVGQTEFYVTRDTKIRKLGSTIMFADLNLLDNAIVSYYEDASGKNIAVRITITVV